MNIHQDGKLGEMMKVGSTWPMFVEHLVERNLISADFAETVLSDDMRYGSAAAAGLRRLGESSGLSPEEIVTHLAAQTGLEGFPDCVSVDAQVIGGLLTPDFMRENRIVPARLVDAGQERKVLLTANPFDPSAIRSALLALQDAMDIGIASLEDIDALARSNGDAEPSATSGSATTSAPSSADLERLRDMASGTPVVALLDDLFERAVDLRATDIHFEPMAWGLTVRLRIDGVLRKLEDQPSEYAAQIVSRLKILSQLDIAEKRRAQDGAARLTVHGQQFDLRISTLPTNHGESVVVRLLTRNANVHALHSMDMSDRDFAAMKRLLDHPYGMIAVTGPTGSGKTTTLAASIAQLNEPGRKIVTVEDPIEYQIDNVVQSQVRSEVDLTFANAIRSFVRQDPDVIMVGEIRDGETARAAIQAAQTGHLLLTTLHSNTAIAAVSRLRNLGLESYLIASNLRGIVAQRLVRLLCHNCRYEAELTREEIASDPRFAAFGFKTGDKVWRARGCSRCAGTGYRGRTPVFEILELDDDIAKAIGEDQSDILLRQIAVDKGMVSLPMDARRKVDQGLTSPDEIFRVTAYL
ncbi:MAG: GspE/PulE family protein [Pseudomonadota bacterium]